LDLDPTARAVFANRNHGVLSPARGWSTSGNLSNDATGGYKLGGEEQRIGAAAEQAAFSFRAGAQQ